MLIEGVPGGEATPRADSGPRARVRIQPHSFTPDLCLPTSRAPRFNCTQTSSLSFPAVSRLFSCRRSTRSGKTPSALLRQARRRFTSTATPTFLPNFTVVATRIRRKRGTYPLPGRKRSFMLNFNDLRSRRRMELPAHARQDSPEQRSPRALCRWSSRGIARGIAGLAHRLTVREEIFAYLATSSEQRARADRCGCAGPWLHSRCSLPPAHAALSQRAFVPQDVRACRSGSGPSLLRPLIRDRGVTIGSDRKNPRAGGSAEMKLATLQCERRPWDTPLQVATRSKVPISLRFPDTGPEHASIGAWHRCIACQRPRRSRPGRAWASVLFITIFGCAIIEAGLHTAAL